jgi:hypothetical protein
VSRVLDITTHRGPLTTEEAAELICVGLSAFRKRVQRAAQGDEAVVLLEPDGAATWVLKGRRTGRDWMWMAERRELSRGVRR